MTLTFHQTYKNVIIINSSPISKHDTNFPSDIQKCKIFFWVQNLSHTV